MIVLSGILVVVAIGLLIDGVFFSKGTNGWQLPVYASIAASIVAGALLAIGAYLRRDEFPSDEASAPGSPPGTTLPRAAAGGGEPAEEALREVPTPKPMVIEDALPEEQVDAATEAAAEATTADVYVVPGRPRYHLAGCRYVADRTDATPLTVAEARHARYTPCGVCKPDEVLALTSGDDAEQLAAEWAEAARLADSSSGAAGGGAAGQGAGIEDEAVGTPTSEDPTPVVVVRNRYHRPECRYVAVATERSDTTRGLARASGALPCGVCRP